MQRILSRYLVAALVASFALMAAAVLPIVGVASAASSSTTCPSGVESGPTCILVISAPESVVAGQTFTVHVAVTTDGSTVAKSDPCGSKVLVRLDVNGDTSFASYFDNASAGVATFDISVANPGFYELFASAGIVTTTAAKSSANCGDYSYISDSADLTAIAVTGDQPIVPCPENVSCVQTTSGSGSAATLFADEGSFTASFGAFTGGCTGPGPADPNGVLTFDYVGSDFKTIIFALRSDLVTKGIGQYKVCWRSDNPFTQLGGTPAPLVGGLYTGYLPSCGGQGSAPCVLFKRSGQHNVAFIGILAAPGDPVTYPE